MCRQRSLHGQSPLSQTPPAGGFSLTKAPVKTAGGVRAGRSAGALAASLLACAALAGSAVHVDTCGGCSCALWTGGIPRTLYATGSGACTCWYLSTRFDGVEVIAENTFSRMESLVEPLLENCENSAINNITFSGLSSLQTLWLYNNRIAAVNNITLSGVPNLQNLILHDMPFDYPAVSERSHRCKRNVVQVRSGCTITAQGPGVGQADFALHGRHGSTGCGRTDWVSRSVRCVNRCHVRHGAGATRWTSMSVGEGSGSVSQAWSVDLASVSVAQRGNGAGTGSGWMTMQGSGMGPGSLGGLRCQ